MDFSDLSIRSILEYIRKDQILAGIPLDQSFPDLGESALTCITETHTQESIDQLVGAFQKAMEEDR